MRKPPLILLADDDINLVRLIQEALQKRGYEVVAVFDGLQAVHKAVELKPDLIITDLQMPAASGSTVYHRLQHSSETFSIPVIFMTAVKPEEARKKVPKMDRVRLLFKPVTIDKLEHSIHDLLGMEGEELT
ncbi:MAG: response regulator [Elusimicrobia bacterium]|nr:response regulator [Elusimicrobiota bacterium]